MIKLRHQLNKAYRYLFAPPEEGQGLIEYALLLFFIAIVLIGVMATLGPTIYNLVYNVVDYGLS